MPSDRQALVADVGMAMQRYQRSVQAFDDAVGRALGLNPSDVRCLDWLVDGPRTMSQLAAGIGLRPAATSALVDRLEARGLVARTRPEGNRRQVVVEMTERGQDLTGRHYGPLVVEGQTIMDRLSRDELQFLLRLLGDITDLTDRHRARAEGSEGSEGSEA
ncbi:MarR family winged helix-turn-helix transcriptional regulator [Jatrophihabitans fulvus]